MDHIQKKNSYQFVQPKNINCALTTVLYNKVASSRISAEKRVGKSMRIWQSAWDLVSTGFLILKLRDVL